MNKIYIHHHSFNYLNAHSQLFFIVNKIAGKKAKHIVLGQRMATKLSSLYKIEAKNIVVLSNLAFFDKELNQSKTSESLKLGYLSNLCIEKGLSTFISVCRILNDKNISFTAEIAGPFADNASKKLVQLAVKNFPQLTYLGPLYGANKDKFYSSVDSFIFPTQYKNEAEPLVLYEAASSGTLLIGTQRGCMQAAIEQLQGFSIKESAKLANEIAETIIHAKKDGLFHVEARKSRQLAFKEVRIRAKNKLHALLTEMAQHDKIKNSYYYHNR
ncbi:glycosyltransferase [Thalassotalea euphylliae]|nr:glycosyltransferase [Thalassotalea euphylliae]